MPCYDTRPEIDYLGEANKKINKLTRRLCEAVELLRANDLLKNSPKKLQKWATHHAKMDKIRLAKEANEKEREQAKSQALAKLTPEERNLLGVK